MIVVLTKADALRLPAFNQLRQAEGLSTEVAVSRTEDHAEQMLNKLKEKIEGQLNGCKYPPKAYLSLTSK